MKERNLRLVVSNNVRKNRSGLFYKYLEYVKDKLKSILISKREKVYVLKDSLLKIYRDYEITTGINEIPYYERAELKISEIIQENKIDYYYNIVEKLRKKNAI